MKRLAVAVAAGILAAGAGAVAASWTADGHVPLTGQISLVGTVKEHHEVQPEGSFPGRETWLFSLASVRAKGKPFGYAILVCAFVSIKTSLRQCSGGMSLPRGKIVLAGPFLYSTLYELAVTGGTALYSGVGGNLSVRQFVDRKTVYWFTVTLR